MTTTRALTCHCCGRPIPVGQERTYEVHQGSGAAPDVVVHKRPCLPVYVRRHL